MKLLEAPPLWETFLVKPDTAGGLIGCGPAFPRNEDHIYFGGLCDTGKPLGAPQCMA